MKQVIQRAIEAAEQAARWAIVAQEWANLAVSVLNELTVTAEPIEGDPVGEFAEVKDDPPGEFAEVTPEVGGEFAEVS